MTKTAPKSAQLSSLQRAAFALKELRHQYNQLKQQQREPIAIVGLSCRFPEAPNPEAYWRLLTKKKDTIRETPKSRWDLDHYFDANPNKPGKISSRYGAYLDQIDQFDAAFFGISPKEAIHMDPQQRLLLELTWEALENAAIAPESLRGSRTGLFLGFNQNDYGMMQLTDDPEEITTYTGTGNGHCFSAGRLAYTFGLQGPTMAIDTACSSSAVALNQAINALRQKQCHIALVGGVQLNITPELQIFFSKTHSFSPDGRCFTFDQRANGFVLGEGGAVIVLKTLSQAKKAHDPILAVIHASEINHDGPASGLTVPNESAQESLIRDALKTADIHPDTIQYAEAHGTGTTLGDPIEVGALKAVFSQRSDENPLKIGSVKTNIGHLNAAAGIAGLIKVVLMLQHKTLAPQLHFKNPNPKIPWEDFPVQVVSETEQWLKTNDTPRRASVSSFGLSGTNSYTILEEAPSQKPASRIERPFHLFTLSAPNRDALQNLIKTYDDYLTTIDDSEIHLADLCATVNRGRNHFQHRFCHCASDIQTLHQALKKGLSLKEPENPIKKRGVVYLFYGQAPLVILRALKDHPHLQQMFTQYDQQAKTYLKDSFHTLIDHPPANTDARTPLITALSFHAMATLWQKCGIEPEAIMGEGVALWAGLVMAGGVSLEEMITQLTSSALRIPLNQALKQTNLPLYDLQGQPCTNLEEQSHSPAIQNLKKKYSFFIAMGGVKENTILSIKSTTKESIWQDFLKSIQTLYQNGLSIDWRHLNQGYASRTLSLPNYPFQRQSYWIQPKSAEKKQDFATEKKKTPEKMTATPPPDIKDSTHTATVTPTQDKTSTQKTTPQAAVSDGSMLSRIMAQQLQTTKDTLTDIIKQQLDMLHGHSFVSQEKITEEIPELKPAKKAAPTKDSLKSSQSAASKPDKGNKNTVHSSPITASEKSDALSMGSWRLLLLAADHAEAMQEKRAATLTQLKTSPEKVIKQSLAALNTTTDKKQCLFLPYQSAEDAIGELENPRSRRTALIKPSQAKSNSSLIFMFPGVGDHYLNMAQGLYKSSPQFKKDIDYCCEKLIPEINVDLREVLYPAPKAEPETKKQADKKPRFDLKAMLGRGNLKPDANQQRLNRTLHNQPLVFIIEYALGQLWQARGLKPKAMIGYSIGEYSAATLAQVLSLDDALKLVARRAQLISAQSKGAMLAVSYNTEKLQPLLQKDTAIAIISTPEQSVVAGSVPAIEMLEKNLSEKKITCRRLQGNRAMHTPMMKPLHEPLSKLVKTFQMRDPKTPYLSNVTGDWIQPEEAKDPVYWARHCYQTVHFASGVGKLLDQERDALFLEVGPGQSLSSFILQHPKITQLKQRATFPSLRSMYEQQADEAFFLHTLGKLWAAGIPLVN
ncbi:beta-ketoacyl synthase N-terminal-like domain-containing protein [Magnetococcales bacterium HHB-1]